MLIQTFIESKTNKNVYTRNKAQNREKNKKQRKKNTTIGALTKLTQPQICAMD